MILQRNGSSHGQATIPSASVGQRPAHRTEAGSVRYSSLFVAAGHRSRARALALLAEGFRSQHNAAIPTARAAIDHRNTAMLRLLKRHLGGHLHRISTSRVSQAPPLQSLQTTASTHA